MENKVSFLCASRYICVHRQTCRHHTHSPKDTKDNTVVINGERENWEPHQRKTKVNFYSL